MFTQFCFTPMQNFTIAVFSPTYNYFPNIYQLLTRNVSQKYSLYWFLDSVFHLLGLCSPLSITFGFIFPPDQIWCFLLHLLVLKLFPVSKTMNILVSLLPISTFHFHPPFDGKKKKMIPGSSVIMMTSTIIGNNGLIMRTIKIKSFILCISKSSNIHTSVM